MTAAIPQMRDQFRTHVAWIDTQLGDERTWLAGDAPSLVDVDAYMNLWYVRAHLDNAGEMLGEFDHTRAWAGRLRAIGHGARTEMSSAEALELAARSTPETAELHDPNDPNGRKVGDMVEVMPDDYGKIGAERAKCLGAAPCDRSIVGNSDDQTFSPLQRNLGLREYGNCHDTLFSLVDRWLPSGNSDK